MEIRPTISTNIPADPDRKTRAAVKAACIAGATEHHDRNMPWHFEPFAAAKYGYQRRSTAYNELKQKLGLPLNPLTFSGKTKSEILTSYTISATGTRGATLKMKASLLGATSGKVLDIAAINRMLADERRTHDRSRLLRLLERLKKSGGKLTQGQEQAIARNAELTAIAPTNSNTWRPSKSKPSEEKSRSRSRCGRCDFDRRLAGGVSPPVRPRCHRPVRSPFQRPRSPFHQPGG